MEFDLGVSATRNGIRYSLFSMAVHGQSGRLRVESIHWSQERKPESCPDYWILQD
jgi:hypothetical protein